MDNKKKKYQFPIRWGIIGCGDVTEVKSGPAYKKTEGFDLNIVMRRDSEKVKDYASRHQVPHYTTNADDIINNKEIDAIYIATPPDSHRYYGVKVAEAGKICCIEKPLSPSYEDSKAIIEAFEVNKVPLFTAYYRRSLPRFEKVREWIEQGEIGIVRHINWTLHKPASELDLSGDYNWRTDKEVAPGGYFDDLASHALDLFAYHLGEITAVSGISLNQQGLYTAKDAFTANWLHKNGTTGVASLNFGTFHSLDRVEVMGDKGTISYSVFEEEDITLENKNGKQSLFISHPKHVQASHVENIAKHLREESYTHPSLGKSALHTSWVMDEILKDFSK